MLMRLSPGLGKQTDQKKEMKKILLYGHGGAYNHGAEAILRSSVPLFRQAGLPILLSTHFPEQDREFGLDKLVDRLIPADLSHVPEEKRQSDFISKEKIAAQIYRDALSEIDEGTICIAVGGDNYCYPNWYRQSVFHRTVKERGGQSILWGCSVQPEMITEEMKAVLQGHDCIYARESLTANALKGHGIKQVRLLPDPAFLLPKEEIALPDGFGKTTAAMNLSPLTLRKSKELMPAFVETAHFLLSRADSLLLVPHVIIPVDNDIEALRELEAQLTPQERERVCWVPAGANVSQIKYLISKCALLVCCRTHASIAGYSTGVPTLVVGYSIKSKGIGLDLGMDTWVLPLEEGARLPGLAAKLFEMRFDVQQEIIGSTSRILKVYSVSGKLS